MVAIDIGLYIRNRLYQIRTSAEEAERRRQSGSVGTGGPS
jgi:hypothetical protein